MVAFQTFFFARNLWAGPFIISKQIQMKWEQRQNGSTAKNFT
jgi:hypothetical protein